jgi:hypothetical protein
MTALGSAPLGPRGFALPFKFLERLAGAVQINRHNLDLLCNNDCGAVMAPQQC